MKYCKDCKFNQKDRFLGISFCGNPEFQEDFESTTVDLIDGVSTKRLEVTSKYLRESEEYCGVNAKGFKQRNSIDKVLLCGLILFLVGVGVQMIFAFIFYYKL